MWPTTTDAVLVWERRTYASANVAARLRAERDDDGFELEKSASARYSARHECNSRIRPLRHESEMVDSMSARNARRS